MNILNKAILLTCAMMLSLSALAGEYTFTGRIAQITDKKVVMSDDTEFKLPSYRPESSVVVTGDDYKTRSTLFMLTRVGYVEKAVITVDSYNVVKKIVILQMDQ